MGFRTFRGPVVEFPILRFIACLDSQWDRIAGKDPSGSFKGFCRAVLRFEGTAAGWRWEGNRMTAICMSNKKTTNIETMPHNLF